MPTSQRHTNDSIPYLCGCELHKDMGGCGAASGRGAALCVCKSGNLEILCARVKELGNDCSHISAPLRVTLEVNLVL